MTGLIVADVLLGCGVTSLVLALLFTPLVRRLRIIDRPDHRKIHDKPTPKAGGLAIAIAALASVLIWGGGISIILVLVMLTALLGLWDDIRTMSPMAKLLGQVAIAVATVMSGLYCVITGTIFDQALSVLWLIAIMNAFNLIDGMDGLSSGVAVISLGAFLITGLTGGSQHLLIVTAVVGGCLAFLWFNWHPAKIFLGDTGSLMIGYLLGVSAIHVSQSAIDKHLIIVLAAVSLILIFPLFDMLLTIIRRWRLGQPVFAPDRSHTYNLMVDNLGWTVQRCVLFFYCVCFVGGVTGVVVYSVNSIVLSMVTLLVLVLGIVLALWRYSSVSSLNEASLGNNAHKTHISEYVKSNI